jgi:hypothetical protein
MADTRVAPRKPHDAWAPRPSGGRLRSGTEGGFTRWLVRIAVALLVLLAVPIGVLSFYLDEAVSRGASYALGVETRVNLVLRPLSGRVSVLRLHVHNPPGFESRRFLRLHRGRFDLRTRSLREETIVSPLLRLDGVELFLERRNGRYNYATILENLGALRVG